MLINTKSLPTTTQESWKYTNIATIYAKNNIKTLLKESSQQLADWTNKVRKEESILLIIDGVSIIDNNNKLSNISALELHKDNRNMSQLAIENSKHFAIKIAKNVKDSLSLVFLNTDTSQDKLTNISLKIDVDKFANLDLDINFVNISNNSAMNLFFDINISEGAKVNFTNNASKPNNANLITTANYLVNLNRNSEFNGFNLINKGNLLRSDFVVNLNNHYAKFDVRGLYLINNNSIANACFVVNHNASHTYSNVNFRGIVNDNAKSWFNAKAIVNKGLEKVQAFQNNKNIQLSNKAEINTKPELEILSDDVVCSHGATIGQLDKEALFYLQSRGINLNDAKHLLLKSFVSSQITASNFPFKNEFLDEIIASIDEVIYNIV